MKEKQFVLTVKESKELRATGETVHAYGGIGYHIVMADGSPIVDRLALLDNVEFEIVIRK